MRGAPPVRVLCGPDLRWQRVQQLVFAAAAATGAGWVGWQFGWPPAALWGSALPAAALAALAVRHRPRVATLEWTGQAWQLDARGCQPRVRIELGDWLLLEVRLASGRQWLPLDLARCGAPPHLVRAALRAHARPAAEPMEAGRGV